MNVEIKWGKDTESDSEGRPQFVPGDTIEGHVNWLSNHAVEGLRVSLLFESKGKATPQREAYETITCGESAQRGDFAFSFVAPAWPWSFSGKLTSVVWMLQVFTDDPSAQKEWPLVISPSRSEIDLYAYTPEGEPLGKGWRRSQNLSVLRSKRKRR